MSRLLILVSAFLFLVISASAYAADPGHPASAIGPGTFESGDYAFPHNLNVSSNLSSSSLNVSGSGFFGGLLYQSGILLNNVFLQLAGGTLLGNLDMGGFSIQNVSSINTSTLLVGGGFEDPDGGLTIDSQGNIFSNGALTFNGETYTAHGQDINGSIFPFFNSIFSLGNSTNTWYSLYATNIYTWQVNEGGSPLSSKYLNFSSIFSGDISGTPDNLQITGGSVGNLELQDNSVSTAKIQDESITNPKLAPSSINATQLSPQVAGSGLNLSGGLNINLSESGGITISGNSLSLNRSCSTDQILKWSGSSWYCSPDQSGTGGSGPSSWTNDTDYIYPAPGYPGKVNISDNLTVGGDTLFVDATQGRVGIGTAALTQKLAVEGNVLITSGTSNVLLKASGATAQLILRNSADNTDAQLVAGDIFANGKLFVGISEIGPAYNITYGSLTLSGGNNAYYAEGGRIQIYGSTHATNPNQIILNGLGQGEVGIGTTSPSAKLSVNGTLDFSDVTGSVSFFDNETIGDTSNGNSIYIRRHAAEGNSYLKLYIEDDKNPAITSSTGEITLSPGATNVNLITGWNGDLGIQAYGAGNVTMFTSMSSGRDKSFRQGGYISAASGNKYIQWQVSDTTDTFELTRQDANITKFDIQMPTQISSSLNVTANISTPLLCLSGDCQTAWPAGSGNGGWTNDSTTTSTNLNVNVTSGNLTVVNGNLGIGTTNPSVKLQINDSTPRLTFTNPLWGQYSVGMPTNTNAFEIVDDNTGNVLRMAGGSGSIGIGVISPSEKLTVNGSLRVDNASGSPVLFVNATSRNVGIGTTVPGAQLEVAVGTGNPDITGIRISGSNYPTLSVVSTDASKGGQIRLGSSGVTWSEYVYGNDLIFYDTTARVTIKSGGNVGINTTIPNATLQVKGNFSVAGSQSDNAYFFYDNPNVSDTADGQSLYVYRKAAEGNNYIKIYTDQYQSGTIWTDSPRLLLSSNGYNDHDAVMIQGGVKFFVGDPWMGPGGTPLMRFYNYLPSFSTVKYIQFQLNNLTNSFEITREDANITKFDVQMPATFTGGNVGVENSNPQSTLQVGNESDASVSYLQIDTNNGAPASGDCDSDTERGRMVLDYSGNRTYICNGAARGWDYIALSD
jgi:hypothetical protein